MRPPAPHFTYHPKAYEPEVGVMEAIDTECECCGQARGWIYSGNVYTVHNVDHVCPWCIADGSAHRKWDASFCQDIEDETGHPGAASEVAAQALDEALHRTPGYTSWQGAVWKTHCGDVCEFHGDISQAELGSLGPDAEALFRQDHGWLFTNHGSLQELAQAGYTPKGDLSIYKFLCRHCGIVRLHADLS